MRYGNVRSDVEFFELMINNLNLLFFGGYIVVVVGLVLIGCEWVGFCVISVVFWVRSFEIFFIIESNGYFFWW